MQRVALGFWLTLALSSGTVRASAEPSIWDSAREPKLESEYRVLVSVESFLLGHATAWDEMNVQKGTIDYLRGERYADPRLELLLAHLRVESTLSGEQGVRERLESALRRFPGSPLAAHGFLELARIAALQGDLERSCAYSTRALERLWEPDLRAYAYYGRAKATMEQGHPRQALVDYRRSIDLARSPKYRSLAHWGLGVALERTGNLNAAFRELRVATSIQVRSTAFAAQTVLDLPDVFFVPEYDKFYYQALAAMAQADASDVGPQAILDYQGAIKYFERYLSEAEPAGHAYASNAKRLIHECAARVVELQRQPPDFDE